MALSNRLDLKNWRVTILDLPKGQDHGTGLGFCGAAPVGVGESGTRVAPLWWPAGKPEPIKSNKDKLELRSASAPGEVVGIRTANGKAHALLWRLEGPDKLSLHDLHPAGYAETWAMGCGGGQQVGLGDPVSKKGQSAPSRALLWNGSNKEVVELWGPGKQGSQALATDGQTQVGSYDPGENRTARACLWRGTSESFVELHPIPGGQSEALAVSGDEQCGLLFTGKGPRAALWKGSAASFVDLTPKPYQCGRALACLNGLQGGLVHKDFETRLTHAALWGGSADDFFELHATVGSEWNDSNATALAIQAGTLRVLGTVVKYSDGPNPSQMKSRPVLWETSLRE